MTPILYKLILLWTLAPIPGQTMPLNEVIVYSLTQEECFSLKKKSVDFAKSEGKIVIDAQCIRYN